MSVNVAEIHAANRDRNRVRTERVLKLAIEQTELAYSAAQDALFDFLDQMDIPSGERDRLHAAIVTYVKASIDRAAVNGALKAVRVV